MMTVSWDFGNGESVHLFNPHLKSHEKEHLDVNLYAHLCRLQLDVRIRYPKSYTWIGA